MVRRKHTARRSRCAIGRRQSSPESGEERVGDSESPEGIRVRNRPSGGESEGRPAGPAGSVKPTRVD
jgi:hypothetical protein